MEQNFFEEHIATTQTTNPQDKPAHGGKKRARRWARAIPWYCDHFNPVFGESSLWIAVITQAMMDALNRSQDPAQCVHKRDAIHWLTGNGRDFHFVCLLAGVDAGQIRRCAKKAILNDVRWRAEPGKGDRYDEKKRYRRRKKTQAALPVALAEYTTLAAAAWN